MGVAREVKGGMRPEATLARGEQKFPSVMMCKGFVRRL